MVPHHCLGIMYIKPFWFWLYIHTIRTFWFFQLSKEGFFDFLLSWAVADTHHNVIHDDLPANSDP